MKKRLKAKLLALLFGLLAIFTLAGCSNGLTTEGVLQSNNLTAKVTYYANGGTFNGNNDVKEIYYKANSPIFNLGVSATVGDTTLKIERSNYDLVGWYYVKLDGENNPVFQDEKKMFPVLTDTPVDFSQRIEKGENWIIGAKWQAKVKLQIKLVCDEGEKIVDSLSGKTYQNGDLMKEYSYDAGTNSVQAFTQINDKQGGQVFVEYYDEAECVTPVDFPVKQLEDQQTDRVIYARYIDSSWTVVRNESEFKEMWNDPTEGKKYWVARDIVLRRTTLTPMDKFACELQGNGYSVSGLEVEKSGVGNNISLSLFGNIEKSAVIKNITFTDVEAEYSLEPTATPNGTKIHFVFSSLEEGAKVENVTFDGSGTRLTVRRNMNNVFTEGSISVAACLYGGFSSDAEYTAANSNGFKTTFDVEKLVKYR